MDLVRQIEENRIVAILRKVPLAKAEKTAEALVAGGIRLLEITFDQKAETPENTLRSIELAAKRFPEIAVGAGTVMTPEQARLAKEAGASFILAPNTNVAVIQKAKELGLGAVPGAMTPTEIAAAYEAGADVVKLFPAGDLGIGYLKAVRAPINHIPLIAVGGVDHKNLADFIRAGAIGAGIGSNIVNNQLIAEDRFDELTKLARLYMEACKGL
ncbi:MAG: bifunctional 4-hydroxy-2-oxoglutarate aldolase/2-dehydro-3-deoxy-phosphogluconate aldolase [Clostridia bacterium]|nr:bifunctional 4-hydroxy-2-oxoglutarate aldolase/2-dehydro-3-deoxy-phosphogluconate aldolase [Clostridia bacterium]